MAGVAVSRKRRLFARQNLAEPKLFTATLEPLAKQWRTLNLANHTRQLLPNGILILIPYQSCDVTTGGPTGTFSHGALRPKVPK